MSLSILKQQPRFYSIYFDEILPLTNHLGTLDFELVSPSKPADTDTYMELLVQEVDPRCGGSWPWMVICLSACHAPPRFYNSYSECHLPLINLLGAVDYERVSPFKPTDTDTYMELLVFNSGSGPQCGGSALDG